jgi:hypothetical protein
MTIIHNMDIPTPFHGVLAAVFRSDRVIADGPAPGAERRAWRRQTEEKQVQLKKSAKRLSSGEALRYSSLCH